MSPMEGGAMPKPTEPRAMQVVRALRADEGWTGRVFDAHDNDPLGGARVSIVVKGFPGGRSAEGVSAVSRGKLVGGRVEPRHRHAL